MITFDEMKKQLMTSTPLTEAVGEALKKLGDTSKEVAENLYAMGYSGCIGAPGNCPVARYLLDRLPVGNVSVGLWRVLIWPGDDSPDERRIIVPVPVSSFILKFDAGLFPQLREEAPLD